MRQGKRERLLGAAIELLHQEGVERTTLADIAHRAEVPAGGVYYYFKTKDDVVTAVIDAHAAQVRANLTEIESRHDSPKARLKALVEQFASQRELIAEFGCPLGTICSELGNRHLETSPAAVLMRLPIAWMGEQYRALGRDDAEELALELMAAYEGSALLANTMRDPSILTNAARRITRGIDAL
ncbi:TetR/AcrR family transcriptional regulator [Streptomyces sp. PLK6-54]|uniref:TetR/AcrR family transcriptional regulator n=2 Tax=Actinacidiphila acidipaludis TaxID=2873382 RepID=A0ABS7QGN4_9ACTN|nr:TetR/AcrR family transcriptional regulator [Streptomyces acidipaludis]